MLFVGGLLFVFVRTSLLVKGLDLKKEYPKDVLDKIESTYKKVARLLIFCIGVFKVEEIKRENVDYKKYLGPDYKQKESFNTIVTNHSSYFDVIYLCSRFVASFVSKKEISDSFIGVLSNAIKCIYFD